MKPTLAFLILAGASAAVFSQAPAVDTTMPEREPRTAVQAQQHDADTADRTRAQQREKCFGVAATRIKRPDDPCRDHGRSYSRDDLSRTGETDAARALERLDPSITRRR